MFTFNLANILGIKPKKASKQFESLLCIKHDHGLPTPGEIRKVIQKLSRCPQCQFLIFEDYWTDDIESSSEKLCPTCGYRL